MNAMLRSTRGARRTPARRASGALMLFLALGWVVGDAGSAIAGTIAADTTSTPAAVPGMAVPADTMSTLMADSTSAGNALADNTTESVAAVAAPSKAAFADGPGPATFRALKNRLARARHIRLQTEFRTFDLWQLELSRDSVRFRVAGDDAQDEPRVLAWRDVAGIQVRGTQRGTGAKTGAIVVGAGCLVLLGSMAADARWDFSWTDGWAPLLISGALILTLAGALTGALAGSRVSKWETVYP